MKSPTLFFFGSVGSLWLSYGTVVEQWLRVFVLVVTLAIGIQRLLKHRGRTPLFYLVLLCAVSVLIAASFTGCASSPEGLGRADEFYHAATNMLATLAPVAAVAPAPYGPAAGGILGAAVLALTAWNTVLHRRVSALSSVPVAAPPAAP